MNEPSIVVTISKAKERRHEIVLVLDYMNFILKFFKRKFNHGLVINRIILCLLTF